MNKVLNQNSLTRDQLRYAAFQQTAQTQGLPSPIMVPHAWSHPASQTFLIFQKFTFQGTKFIKDAIAKQPTMAGKAAKVAELAVLSQIFGEIIGDTKSAIYGAGQSAIYGQPTGETIAKRIRERQEWVGVGGKVSDVSKYITGNKLSPEAETVINRFVVNLLQSWALGVYGDIFSSISRGGGDLAKMAIGPFYSDIAEIAGNTVGGNWRQLGKTVVPTPISSMAFPPKRKMKKGGLFSVYDLPIPK